MEFSETPVSTSEPVKHFSPEQFPRYTSFERRGQEDRFLSPEELVSQTNVFMQRFGEMIQKQELPETIFFLDKSARPVAYMFRKLFPIYYPDVSIPKVRFINIGGSGSRLYDTDSRPFTGDSEKIRQTYGEHINVDGRMMIIDEYSHTGQASKHATEVLKKAFPKAAVATVVAYDKLPNWYQNEGYLGVEEYTQYDYERMALEKLNQELGTEYKDRWEVVNDTTQPNSISFRFWEIYREIEGTTPYVKRGKHVLTHYERSNSSLLAEVKNNEFREAREELNRFCEEIVKLKNRSML